MKNINSLKLHNNYFLKKAHSKSNLQNLKKNPNNKSYIIYNNFKKNILFDENLEKQTKLKEYKTNNTSMNNQHSIPLTNQILDSNNNTINKYNDKTNKDIYINNLEKKIINKERQLSQLLNYKNICEKRIKELNPNEVLPLTIDSFNTNYYTNRDNKNSKILNSSYSNKHIKLNSNDLKKYEKTIELNVNNYKEKYNNLYKKYIKLFSDFKNINTNNNNINSIEVNKLKNKIYKIETEYDNIKEKLQKEKNINEELRLQINNLEKKYNEEINSSDKENYEQLKKQNDIYRKDLVLSQALVNSLKAEIEFLNKNKIKKKRSNSYNKILNNNILDNCNMCYNNKINDNNLNNNIDNINNNNIKTRNYNNENNKNNLINENNFLKQSLYSKNMLISNILEENNKLNNLLKYNTINNDYHSNLLNNKDNNNINNNNKSNNYTIPHNTNGDIELMRKNIQEFENKFIYFNAYISNIKKELYKLHQDITPTINNFENENNKKDDKNNKLLSQTFYKEIENIKNNLKDINIDFYNLDYSKDVKCIDLYMQFNKIIYEELNNILYTIKNNDYINKKELNSIIDLFELSKGLMKDESLKKTLSDILNITLNINKLYRQKLSNFQNNNNFNEESNNLDKILINQEKELEKIKKSLFDININSNFRKTYYIINNYNNNNNLNNYQNGNNWNNNYKPNYTDNYNITKNYEIKAYFRNQNNYNDNDFGKKKYSNSRDKILNRLKL